MPAPLNTVYRQRHSLAASIGYPDRFAFVSCFWHQHSCLCELPINGHDGNLIPDFSLLLSPFIHLDPISTNGSRYPSSLMRLVSGSPTSKEALEWHLPIHSFHHFILPIPTLIQSYDLFKPRKTPDWLSFFVTSLADLPFWSPTKLLCRRIAGVQELKQWNAYVGRESTCPHRLTCVSINIAPYLIILYGVLCSFIRVRFSNSF